MLRGGALNRVELELFPRTQSRLVPFTRLRLILRPK